jgi:glycosyltransferase involved in cell wall biosynthesis
VPFAKGFNKKVVIHLHDYQPISYSSSVFHDSYENGRISSVRDTVRLELLEHNSPSRAFLTAMLYPINLLSRPWISEGDKIICVSERQMEILSLAAPGLTHKMRLIHNPSPPLPFRGKKKNEGLKGSDFLYVGGDSILKGVHILAEAVASLSKDHDFICTIVDIGDGKWRKFFQKIDGKNNSTIHIHGRLSYEALSKIRSRATALVFPSIIEEPAPYAVLEAMLSGTIPVASNVGGIPEIVEGTYAEKMLFEPWDVDGLEKRMMTVLSLSDEEMQEIGWRLKEKTKERFQSKKAESEFLSIFN